MQRAFRQIAHASHNAPKPIARPSTILTARGRSGSLRMTLASGAPHPLVSEYLPRPNKYVRSASAETFNIPALLRRGRVQRRERGERGCYSCRRSGRIYQETIIKRRRGRLWRSRRARVGPRTYGSSRVRSAPRPLADEDRTRRPQPHSDRSALAVSSGPPWMP